jgi:hypothetical protein
MSSEKPRATDKKVFDITKPGKSAPSASSKPIIITNRPVLKDPMVTAETPGTTSATEAVAPSKPRTKITIAPLGQEPEESVKTLEDTPAQVDAEAAPGSAAPEAPMEVVEKPSEEEPKPEVPAEKPAAPKAASGSEPTPAEASTEPAVNDEESKGETTKQAAGDAQKTSDKEAEEAARLELERQAALQKIIDSRQYALPINTVEKRRNKRDILLGALFILLLAVVWFDIALDAGMIHVQGVHAYTHFFTK